MSDRITVSKKAHFTGHKDCVYCLDRDADARFFYSGAGDGMIVKWNIDAPDQGELMAKVPHSVYAIKYIASSHQLLVGQNFEGIHLIDTVSKREIRSLKITASYIFDIQYYEQIAIIACGDGEVILLDLISFTKVFSFQGSDKSARCISINPILKEFAIGYSDHTIRIYSLIDYSLQKVIHGHTNSVFTVRYSPDFKYLISGSRDATLRIWDCWNHYELHQSIVAHMYAINHIEFGTDNLFATCSMDKTIKIWSMEDFRLLKVIDKSRYAGHGTSVNKLQWLNGQGLVSCSDDRTISLWGISL